MPRYRIRYSKEGTARFMSHLDMVRTFERAVRRAGIPVSLSQGFNPHSKMAFGFPLPVGVSGLAEYVDIDLDRDVSPDEIVHALGPAMPPGFEIAGARRLEDKVPALMAEVERSSYTVSIGPENALALEDMEKCLEGIMGQVEITVSRRKKDGPPADFNIRPGMLSLSARKEGGRVILEMELMSGSTLNVRPGEVVSALRDRCGMPGEGCHLEITRIGMWGPGGKDLFGA